MKKLEQGIRWSAWLAQLEFGVTANKVKLGLKVHGVAPGKDGKYSTREIAQAIFSADGLEQRAKRARFEGQIAEADTKKLKHDQLADKLLDADIVERRFLDFAVTLMQKVRHSSLTDQEKKQFTSELRAQFGLPPNEEKPQHAKNKKQER